LLNNLQEQRDQKKIANLHSSLASMASFRSGKEQSALKVREVGNQERRKIGGI